MSVAWTRLYDPQALPYLHTNQRLKIHPPDCSIMVPLHFQAFMEASSFSENSF